MHAYMHSDRVARMGTCYIVLLLFGCFCRCHFKQTKLTLLKLKSLRNWIEYKAALLMSSSGANKLCGDISGVNNLLGARTGTSGGNSVDWAKPDLNNCTSKTAYTLECGLRSNVAATPATIRECAGIFHLFCVVVVYLFSCSLPRLCRRLMLLPLLAVATALCKY